MFSKLKTQVGKKKKKKKSSILDETSRWSNLLARSKGAQRAKLEKSPIGRLLSKAVSPSFRRWLLAFNARPSPPDPLPSLFLFRFSPCSQFFQTSTSARQCARFKWPVNLFDGPPIRNQYPHLFSINNKSEWERRLLFPLLIRRSREVVLVQANENRRYEFHLVT